MAATEARPAGDELVAGVRTPVAAATAGLCRAVVAAGAAAGAPAALGEAAAMALTAGPELAAAEAAGWKGERSGSRQDIS